MKRFNKLRMTVAKPWFLSNVFFGGDLAASGIPTIAEKPHANEPHSNYAQAPCIRVPTDRRRYLAFLRTIETGPHHVGLRVVEQYDYSRTYRHFIADLGKPFQGERARPLQTLIRIL